MFLTFLALGIQKRREPQGFLALLEGPGCPFRIPLGPQPLARSGIPGPRMDEIVYFGIIGLFFFCLITVFLSEIAGADLYQFDEFFAVVASLFEFA